MLIRESLAEAFKRNWGMFLDAVKNIPNEHWRTGDVEHLIPSRILYHVLECVDFYTNPTPEGFVWGRRFNIDWEKMSPEQMPTKAKVKEYLEEMMEKTGEWLNKMSDSDLMSSEEAFPWTGKTKLGHAIYVLVHCRQHLGEINAELRRRGQPRIKWR